MKIFLALVTVLGLCAVALVGAGTLGLHLVFGVVVPYFAVTVFLVGIVAKVLGWARSPVPFRIPTTCGQQRSLDWIEPARLDNPSTKLGVVGRMALEVLAFRSLFRNTQTELHDGKLAYLSNKWLWAAALAFHYSFLVVLLRHLRIFTEPVSPLVQGLVDTDGFLQVGVPPVFLTSLILVGAVSFLLLRRLVSARSRYLSLPADYLVLFLLLGIALSGIWIRHFDKIDVPAVKAMMMGMVHLTPVAPAQVSAVFYLHLFLVSTLVAYFPFSKLMHLGGVFLSPTRNLPNDNRARHHVNPWNRPLPVHTYAEYEDEFRDRMRDAGLPLDKE